MTTISANAARPIGADSFADLPGLEEVAASVSVLGGKVVVTFDAELTPEQADAVWARMTSRDDAHQAKRASLDTRRKAVMAAINPLEVGDPLKVIGTAVAQLIDIELNKPA